MSSPVVNLTIGQSEIFNHPLFKNPDKWSQDITRAVNKRVGGLFRKWIKRMEKEITPQIPIGKTGDLQKSFKGEPVTGKGIDLSTRYGTNIRYAAWHEYGTGKHFPPVSALVGWVVAKGTFTDERGRPITESSPAYIIRGMAYIIARVISRRGTIPGNEQEEWLAKNEVKVIREIVNELDEIMTGAI